ncbi:high affinity immunoglobulin epsilon receptor subunit beta isoform X2 [Cricetulus griseus]|uniref:high affinity immunoglobulin epsilon receptor subunit beta isoform X2 n=1 Tax=Cricetulus griseus TaxID=10029 RepID=UPI0015C3E72E|nr:high affinity immunoglobulin epsilon receptor subunit beta isoform X2 [Cricetulus griseus]XP_035297280.1 high affinity immunoglobulin epsilon receptor subunit beta isoform X2 [Cricetulus griseus]
MDAENKSRADLALPNPQESPSAPDIELLEVSPAAEALPAKPAPPPPQQTWQTVLKSDLEFLGVTQILAGLVCLCFGTIFYSSVHISDFDDEVLLLYRTGYPFWGPVLFVLSGFLSVMSERKNTLYLDLNEDDGCFVTAFITEMVSMMLFLTMLAFCSAVLHTIYRIGEAFKSNKVTDDRLYEELNVYSPIYSELEDKGETSSPVGS